ncbi:MAG: hypothetical protein AAFQ57_16635 [Cyanobacteria bacterium J06626_14]
MDQTRVTLTTQDMAIIEQAMETCDFATIEAVVSAALATFQSQMQDDADLVAAAEPALVSYRAGKAQNITTPEDRAAFFASIKDEVVQGLD